MEKKNLDWGNLGFGYVKLTIVTFQTTQTEHGMQVS